MKLYMVSGFCSGRPVDVVHHNFEVLTAFRAFFDGKLDADSLLLLLHDIAPNLVLKTMAVCTGFVA